MSLPQPVPPSWKDLGKSSNDLLGKDFHFQGTSLEIKTKTPSNVSFKVTGSHSTKTDLIHADLEGKYTDIKNGVTLTQTWTTANLLKTQLEVENQLAKGLKLDLSTSLTPDKEKNHKNALLSAIYKQSGIHTRAAVDVYKGPTFTADTVLGRDGFLVGAEASYDITKGEVTHYAAAVGYSAPEYAVTIHALHNLNTFTASYYHKVSADVEAGAKAVYDHKGTHGAHQGVALEVGGKAYLDSAAFLKAKINNSGVLALGYTQALRPGIKASFGLALDTQKLNDPTHPGHSHKVGAQFVFES